MQGPFPLDTERSTCYLLGYTFGGCAVRYTCPSSGASWCCFCYANRRGRTNRRGHSGYRKADRDLIGGLHAVAIDKPGSSNGTSAPARHYSDTQFGRLFPVLAEWLTAERYADGTPRETSTITVFADGGLFKVCFTDRGVDRKLWASGDDLLDAFALLEKWLSSGTGEWRGADNKRKRK